jgi:hypothetical protein
MEIKFGQVTMKLQEHKVEILSRGRAGGWGAEWRDLTRVAVRLRPMRVGRCVK